MTKKYLFPALAVSFVSMVLLVLVTISTPTTLSDDTQFDFVRSSNLDGIVDRSDGANSNRSIGGAKFGTWGYCTATNGTSDYACFKKSHGYSVTFGISAQEQETAARSDVTIGSSWTRGLAVHVVAFVASIVGLVLTAVPKQVIRLAAMIVNALSALLALIAFAIDIALYVYVQRQMNKIAPAKTMPGPAFYMALIAIPLALVATAFNYLNWRSESLDHFSVHGNDYPLAPASSDKDVTTPSSQQKVLDAYQESKTA